MLTLVVTAQFKRDLKRAKKRGKNMAKLNDVLEDLCSEKFLPESMKDHALIGNYQGFRECHIEPDWLLVYSIDGDRLIVTAAGTGTHSDLFS